MAYLWSTVVLDGSLDILATADDLSIVEGEPASFADATTAKGSGGSMLAHIAVEAADFAKAAGDSDGRKITVAAQDIPTAAASGDADHWALTKSTGSVLLAYGQLSALQAITAGNPVHVNAIKMTNRDLTAEA